jgi:hypothetical protein
MKLGSITFEKAIKTMHQAHCVMCDQIGEFVSFSLTDDAILQIHPHSGSDDNYEILKSQNENVDVCVATNSNYSFQYMRMYTEDGDEMDFVVYQPAPIITLSSLLHPTA